MTAEGDAKCVAFVHKRDSKPKRRIFELLKSQGVYANQPVTFLSDGGETVRNLQLYLNPLAEHLLDWFHLSMKLTVMGQMNKGMQKVEARDLIKDVEKQLDSLKYHLWNGNTTQALRLIDYLQLILRDDPMSLERKKVLKAVREFGEYIATNQQFIPDYGDRYRNDEPAVQALGFHNKLPISFPPHADTPDTYAHSRSPRRKTPRRRIPPPCRSRRRSPAGQGARPKSSPLPGPMPPAFCSSSASSS
jgi:hypothetical protein